MIITDSDVWVDIVDHSNKVTNKRESESVQFYSKRLGSVSIE
jgi:hypothetical protein